MGDFEAVSLGVFAPLNPFTKKKRKKKENINCSTVYLCASLFKMTVSTVIFTITEHRHVGMSINTKTKAGL